jgi:hypothetical protein
MQFMSLGGSMVNSSMTVILRTPDPEYKRKTFHGKTALSRTTTTMYCIVEKSRNPKGAQCGSTKVFYIFDYLLKGK